MDDDLKTRAKQNIKDYWKPTSSDEAISNAWQKAKSLLTGNEAAPANDATMLALQRRTQQLQGQN